MITKREAERLCKSFLGDNAPPKLPENFAFEVMWDGITDLFCVLFSAQLSGGRGMFTIIRIFLFLQL
jgi:hypothetical protein